MHATPKCSSSDRRIGGTSPAKILCVLTGASYWTLKDGHRHPTGYWAEEFVAPYGVFTDAGHTVTVATPHGVVPVTDTMSLEPRMAGGEENALRPEAVARWRTSRLTPTPGHCCDRHLLLVSHSPSSAMPQLLSSRPVTQTAARPSRTIV